MTAVSDRPTLALRGYLGNPSAAPEAALALVGEAPGPNTMGAFPLWPSPPQSAAGRLKAMVGLSQTDYLRTFARANLLDAYPGPTFPLSRARPLAAPLAQRLAPRPLLLLGRGVAGAFRLPTQDILTWVDYELEHVWVRAALVPHPSGRNLFYNDPQRREQVGSWLREQVALHQPK